MLRPATVDDYWKFYGKYPEFPDTWIGLVSEGRYMLEGIGGMYWGAMDRWWACLDRAPGIKGHRDLAKATRWLVDTAREFQIDLYALPDPKLGGAEKLLRRMEFEPTDETYSGITIWRLKGAE